MSEAALREQEIDARRGVVAVKVLGGLLLLGAVVLAVLGLLLVGAALDSGGPGDDPWGLLGTAMLFLIPGALVAAGGWWLLRRPLR